MNRYISVAPNGDILFYVDSSEPIHNKDYIQIPFNGDGLDISKLYYNSNTKQVEYKMPQTRYNYLIPANEFRKRFTIDERIAIKNKAKVDPILSEFIIDLDNPETINLQDPEIMIAMDRLINIHRLLTGERVDAIMKPIEIVGY